MNGGLPETVEEMESTLQQWGSKLDRLASTAKRNANAGMKSALMRITDLRSRRGRAQTRLAEFRLAEYGSEAWHNLKSTLDHAFLTLGDAIRTVRP